MLYPPLVPEYALHWLRRLPFSENEVTNICRFATISLSSTCNFFTDLSFAAEPLKVSFKTSLKTSTTILHSVVSLRYRA